MICLYRISSLNSSTWSRYGQTVKQTISVCLNITSMNVWYSFSFIIIAFLALLRHFTYFILNVNYSVTELPEHLKSGGIPSFFRMRPWHQYCLPFGYAATFIISGFFSPVKDSSFCFPDTERYFRRILNAPTASALNLTPSVIYIPRSFRFDDSAYLFDISGENGLHWLV